MLATLGMQEGGYQYSPADRRFPAILGVTYLFGSGQRTQLGSITYARARKFRERLARGWN